MTIENNIVAQVYGNPGKIKNESSAVRFRSAELLAPEIGESDERIERVILFGSSARGSACPLSDIDLALTGNWPWGFNEETALTHAQVASAALGVISKHCVSQRSIRIQVTVVPKDILENPNNAPDPALSHSIIRDGIELWRRQGRLK